jgi:hypothetical protein
LSPGITYRLYFIEDDYSGTPIFSTLAITFITAKNTLNPTTQNSPIIVNPTSGQLSVNITSTQIATTFLSLNVNMSQAGN